MSNVTAIIPARGGSKGIPNKNICLLKGIPLIAHTIRAALESPMIDQVVVSTEDSRIHQVAKEWGVEVISRPQELATDISLSRDVVLHALDVLKKTDRYTPYFVLLQPTSPLRSSRQITSALKLFLDQQQKSNSLVSVCECEHHPYKTFISLDGVLSPVNKWEFLDAPRQTLPKAFHQNGAIYCMASDLFVEKKMFFVEPILPFEMDRPSSIDIDTVEDFVKAEEYIQQKV